MEISKKQEYIKPQIAELSMCSGTEVGKGGDANEGNPAGMSMANGMTS